jgi:hypothetical protein
MMLENMHTNRRVRAAGYKEEEEFMAASVTAYSYLGGVGMGGRHSVQVGRGR